MEYFNRIDLPLSITRLESICDRIMENLGTEENIDCNDTDGDESDDDDYGDNIFPDTYGSNLSTICEYEDFEELD